MHTFRRQDDVHHFVRVHDRYFETVALASRRNDHLSSPPSFRRRNDQRVRAFVVDEDLQCDEIGQYAPQPLRGVGSPQSNVGQVIVSIQYVLSDVTFADLAP